MKEMDLFKDSRSPYYIVSPTYNDGGLAGRVLTHLCHALNMMGYEAYITTLGSLPGFRTPFLSESVKARHRSEGREPIVIYPDSISGNPFGATRIVRYFVDGRYSVSHMELGPEDFVLEYSPEFLPSGIAVDGQLFLPSSDLAIFDMENEAPGGRAGACLFAGTHQGDFKEVPPDAIRITEHHIKHPDERSKLFRSVEFMYCHEFTPLVMDALLCGCTVVYIAEGLNDAAGPMQSFLSDGVAWGSSPEQIRKARETVGNVIVECREKLSGSQMQLRTFVNDTQALSAERGDGEPSSTGASVALALELAGNSGVAVDEVAKNLVKNGKLSLDGTKDRERFYLDLVITLHDMAGGFLGGSSVTGISGDTEESLNACDSLLLEVLGTGENKSEATRLQTENYTRRQNMRYQRWRASHGLKEIDGHIFAERMMYQWHTRPVFHFIVFLYPGRESLLGDTLDSLSEQLYSDWRFTVIADTPAPDSLWGELEVLNWVQCGSKDDPYALANNVVADTAADWVCFIEAGTQWERHALLRVADYANKESGWQYIYSDTDSIDEKGERSDPRFLPDLNLDMLRSIPYSRQGSWISRDALRGVGGFDSLPGCEMHDLAFKVVERWGEKAVGHIQDVLVHTPKEVQEPDEAILMLTVRNHLERSGISALAGPGYLPGTVRVNHIHAEEEFVSIVIVNRNKSEYISSCVKSLVAKTAYENFEIIIADLGSDDPDTLGFYEEITGDQSVAVHVMNLESTLTVAEACNKAAAEVSGEYLLFLKHHVEAKQAQWLSRIMSHAQRPDVGIVGPRVVFPETTFLADAGLILGMGDVAGKPFVSQLTLGGKGYMERAQIDQNFSAVSDTALMIRKSLFDKIGGMDTDALSKDYLDVDLCMRVGEAGYKIVWTPYSVLMAYRGNAHISDKTKGEKYLHEVVALNAAREAIMKKWFHRIIHDPCYNQNLDLTPGNAFLVNDKLPMNWDIRFHERSRVLGLPLSGGSGEYRIIQPFDVISRDALQQTEHRVVVKGMSNQMSLVPIARMDPDVLVVQAGIDDMHVGLLQDIAEYKPEIFRVFSLDDLITEIPETSSVYRHFKGNFRNARARLRKALSLCDRMIVTTRTLADAYSDMIDDIRVIPNRLQKDVWIPLESRRRVSQKPRIGWVGAQQHKGDLEIIIDVVKKTSEALDWVFMGMCPEEIRPYVKEYHIDWVDYEKYPEKMASLNLDIAVAPLEINRFNEAKSNLRLLEYGILGWPVVCTDITPYQTMDAPVKRVPNETDAWVEAIMRYANNLELAEKEGDALRKWVKRHFILEDHINEWARAFTPVNSSVPIVQGKFGGNVRAVNR